MVCTANDLQEWKDFPKGLKVLLLEGDNISATEIRAKLEAMDYNVSAFCDENEALSAISSIPESFHIAIVEVSSSNSQGVLKFLENAKDLPTIIEFLSKPLSEDKLRNIWQHVVHKAFNAGESVMSESLKPVKESVVSMLQLQTDNEQHESRVSIDIEKVSRFSDNDHEPSPGNDKYPAPSTPQLRQGTRLLDDGDCQEQTNCSTDKEGGENDGESKSVDTTCGNLNAEGTPQERMRLLDDGDCQEQTNCSTDKGGANDGESNSVETTCGNLNAEGTPQERMRLLDDGDCQEQTNCSTDKGGENDGESKSVETTCGNLNAEGTPQERMRLLDDGDCQEQTNCSTDKGGENDGESKSVETTCGNLNAEGTPQERMRLLDDGDCQEQTNCSTDKEGGENDGESKSVETTCGNLNAEGTPQERMRLLDDGDCQEQTNYSTDKEGGENDGESKSVETTCGNLNAEGTPQERMRLLNDGDCQEQTNCSTEKESGEHDGESKSVETTCGNLNAESTPQQRECKVVLVKEDLDLVDASKGESVASPHTQKRKVLSNNDRYTKPPNKEGVHSDSCDIRAKRKKIKVDWTPELHKKFVKAVEQLGIDQAIPSRILELMEVEGLTRHNVASHLQKYRIHKRQILPKEEDRKWLNQRERNFCVQRPIMAFPPYHSNHTLPLAPVYPMWGQSGTQTAGMQIWGSPGYPMWQPAAENWHWKPFPGVHADAWGCPVLPVPPPQAPCFAYPQNMPALFNAAAVDHKYTMPESSFEHYPTEEVVDNVVKEAINKPWLPLPLGLKPPSTDSVLAELSRQGISSIPPCSKGSYNSG